MNNIIYALLFVPLLAHGQCDKKLELDFVQDSGHELIDRVERLPNDVRDMLFATIGTENIVNYGEDYLKTDVIPPWEKNTARHQHQVSLVSENSAAISFKSGGIAHRSRLLLVFRTNQRPVCEYPLDRYISSKADIEAYFEARWERAKDIEERIKALQAPAEAGDAEAQLQLYYAERSRVGRLPRSSLKWLCRAADLGLQQAQSELAGEYLRGNVVKHDKVQAQVWVTLAIQGGADWDDRRERRLFDRQESLDATMTPNQKEEVKRRIDAWAPGQCEQALLSEKTEK